MPSSFLPSFRSCVLEARLGRAFTHISSHPRLTGVVLIVAGITQHSKENTYAMQGMLPLSHFGATTVYSLQTPKDAPRRVPGPCARFSFTRLNMRVCVLFFYSIFFSLPLARNNMHATSSNTHCRLSQYTDDSLDGKRWYVVLSFT